MIRRLRPRIDAGVDAVRRRLAPPLAALAVAAALGRSAVNVRKGSLFDRLRSRVAAIGSESAPASESASASVSASTSDSASTDDGRAGGRPELLERRPTTRSEILECGATPETYVRTVLERHGGRLPQHRFVDDYGWAPATVSRLLSDLEGDGAIARYRIGHRKVVCAPGSTPDCER